MAAGKVILVGNLTRDLGQVRRQDSVTGIVWP